MTNSPAATAPNHPYNDVRGGQHQGIHHRQNKDLRYGQDIERDGNVHEERTQ